MLWGQYGSSTLDMDYIMVSQVSKGQGWGALSQLPPMSSQLFGTIEALIFYWISRSYLTGVRYVKTFDSIPLLPVYSVYIGLDNGLAPDQIIIQLFQGICVNYLPLDKNGRRFAADVFRCIFVNKNVCSLIKISLTFVSQAPTDYNTSIGLDYGLSPTPDSLMHICGTTKEVSWYRNKKFGVLSIPSPYIIYSCLLPKA